MNEWHAGNKPPYTGLYWITLIGKNGLPKVCETPAEYLGDGVWKVEGRYKSRYFEDITAYMDCNRPKQPYNENHIGFPNQYYIRVKCNGITRYLPKGLQSVKWSKEGYATTEKAKVAVRRLKKVEPEYGYQGQKTEIVVVNGNGEEV